MESIVAARRHGGEWLSEEQFKAARRAEAAAMAPLVPRIRRALDGYAAMRPDRHALRTMQSARLRTLLDSARRNVPAYRQLDGVTGDPFRDLERFPIVDKPALRERFVDHCSDRIDPKDCFLAATSGTTGVPARIVHDWNHLVHVCALTILRRRAYGMPDSARILEVWRATADWFVFDAPAFVDARIGGFPLDPTRPVSGETLDRLREFAPHLVRTDPTNCLELASMLDERARTWFAPQAVELCGERLSGPARRRLSDAFDAPVFDLYGMREFSAVAVECTAGRRHLECERLWVQVVDVAGEPVSDGVCGELVITNLLNLNMPLIRHRTGDFGTLDAQPCPCGRPHKTLSSFAGREPGAFTLPGGRPVAVNLVRRLLASLPLEQFQMVRDGPRTLTVYVKPDPAAPAPAAIARDVRQLLDGAVAVTVRATDGAAFVRRGHDGKHVDFVDVTEPDTGREGK